MRSVLKNRRFGFEVLEGRQMLAGGAFVANVVTQQLPQATIQPNATNQVLAAFSVSNVGVGRPYIRLSEVLGVPMAEPLFQNVQGKLALKANLVNNAWTTVAYATPDSETDLLDFNKFSKSVWIRPRQTVNFQVVALSMATTFTGDSLGLDIAEVDFRDLRNRPIPDTAVWYGGADPTLFTLQQPQMPVEGNLVFAGSSPADQIVAGNQQVVAAAYKAVATGGGFTVKEAKVTLLNPSAAVLVIGASLYDQTGQTLAMAPYDASDKCFKFTGLDFQVPANTIGSLGVRLNLAPPSVSGQNIYTGLNVQVVLTSVTAIDSHGTAVTITPNISGHELWVYKSYPTFSSPASTPVTPIQDQLDGLSLSLGGQTSISKIVTVADPHGNVSFKKFVFNITVDKGTTSFNSSLDGFKLFRGDMDLTSLVDFSASSIGLGATSLVVTFKPEEEVPAGMQQTYRLAAMPHYFSKGSGAAASVSTKLVDLVWSDNSALMHGLTTSDWFSGSPLLGLPVTKTITAS